MSWVARSQEERLARAAAAGELSAPSLEGKPLPDLDRPRNSGWWADRFVARERSHDRREEAQHEIRAARARFWRAVDADAVRAEVRLVNERIGELNATLVEDDRIPAFDASDIVARWRRLHRS